ncbi:MAG: SGNH/GDSL hydrolase family protein [Lachnospiraceae bacterium]|nr:SGNH/GDSL hydrolase family protein [Lachnospiraceae bacterium]
MNRACRKMWMILPAVLLLAVGMCRIRAQAAPVRMPDGTIFDAAYYADRYTDLREAFGDDGTALWQHFVTNGRAEGRYCLPFDYRFYADRYADLKEAFGYDEAALWQHYLNHGMREDRQCHQGQVLPEKQTGMPTALTSIPQGMQTQGAVSVDDLTAMSKLGTSLFIGDSVMQGYALACAASDSALLKSFYFVAAPSYSVTHAMNAAQGGLHPPYRGKRLPPWEVVADLKPQTVFLSFGVNDLTYTAPQTLIEKYTALAAKLQEAYAGVRIVIISTTYPYPGTNKVYLNSANVQALNAGMQAACAENGWDYIDVATPLSDGNGSMNPAFSSDNYVHFLPGAYEVWTQVIRTYAVTAR